MKKTKNQEYEKGDQGIKRRVGIYLKKRGQCRAKYKKEQNGEKDKRVKGNQVKLNMKTKRKKEM